MNWRAGFGFLVAMLILIAVVTLTARLANLSVAQINRIAVILGILVAGIVVVFLQSTRRR